MVNIFKEVNIIFKKMFLITVVLLFVILIPNSSLANNSLQKSISQFENKFNQNIMLPEYIPFNPTNIDSEFNESLKLLKINYTNKKTNEELMILISLKQNEKINSNKYSKQITLNDGTKTIYSHIEKSDSEFLTFVKNDLDYYLKLTKNGKETRINDLLKIANSFN